MKRPILSVAALLLLFGLLWGVYSFFYPVCGDDFLFFSNAAREGAWGATRSLFMNWSCRLGNVVMHFLCRFGGHNAFAVLNPFMQLATAFLMAGLILQRRINGQKSADLGLLAALPGALAFAARPRDTVYWMTGATVYSWSAVAELGFFYLLMSWRKERSLRKALLLFGAGLAAGYCNENVFVAGCFGLLLLLAFDRSRMTAAGTLGFLTGGACLFLNPGFALRAASAGVAVQGPFLAAALRRLPETLLFWGAAVMVPLLVTGTAAAILFLAKPAGWNDFKVWRKSLVWYGASLFSALVFAGGPLPAMRAYYFSSLLAIGGSGVLLHHLLERSPRAGKMLAAGVCLAGFAVMAAALPDLVKIHEDETERLRLIETARCLHGSDAAVVVPEHRVLRRHFFHYLYVEDLSCDPAFWLNYGAARYYGIRSIAVKERGSRPATYRDKLFPPSRPKGGVTPGSK